jgi:hypothetical protein
MQLTLIISNINYVISFVHNCFVVICSLVCVIFCHIISCNPHAPRGNQRIVEGASACDLLNKVLPTYLPIEKQQI